MDLASVGKAAFGAVFGESLKAVIEVKDKAGKFKSSLKTLDLRLKTITPIVKEIEELKKELNHPKEDLQDLLQQLKEGEELVRKCSKIPSWQFSKKSKYWSKLTELDGLILDFFRVILPVLRYRDKLRNSTGVNGGTNNTNNLILGSCEDLDQSVHTVGLDLPLNELKTMLLNSGEIVHVLSAPGGCGKTTLANALRQDVDIKGKYGTNIFYVTVSKTPNVKKVIKGIIQHKHDQVPNFQSDEEAFNHLRGLLKELEPDPVLFILDDVWAGSESLLDSFDFKRPNYKVLVTSRFVLHRFDSIYKLKLLNDEDAMTLFCHFAYSQNRSPEFFDEDLVKEIVKKCKNNPLALKVIGRSLHGKAEPVWRQRVNDWSKGQTIFNSESEKELLNSLGASLVHLDNYEFNLKECFLDLASFPEDARISAAALIDMWVELYKLDDEYAIVNIHELSDQNLVDMVVTRKDAIEVHSSYNDHFIAQHDILRDLAIHLTQSRQDPVEQTRLIIEIRGNYFPEWFVKQLNRKMKARVLSISTDAMFNSDWCDMKMKLPAVEVLVLNLQTESYTLPKFVMKMKKLKVLIIRNYGFCLADLTNFEILGSLSTLRRIRLEHISITFIRETGMHLKHLQKVSFVMCKISHAFKNFTVRLSKMLTELLEIDIDYCNDLVELPSLLCDIVSLKILNITNCHKLIGLPERIGNLKNLKVLRLHACIELRELPISIGSLHNLSILDISDCLSIRKFPEQMGDMCNLIKIHMRGCSNFSELPTSVTKLDHLRDVFCDEEKARLWELYQPLLNNLRIKVLKENINLHWLY